MGIQFDESEKDEKSIPISAPKGEKKAFFF